eukprot:6208227-Pleurochrysis_carterae.AAC.2
MTPASSERRAKSLPPFPLRGHFHRWSCGRSGRSGPRSGRTGRATRCPVPRLGVASVLPAPTRACATDGSSATARIRTRRQPRVPSVRGGGRGSPHATAPDPSSPERGMCQPRNGQPAT